MLSSLLLYQDIGLFLLRLAVAIVFLAHAFPKLQNKMGSAFLLLGVVEALSAVALVLGWYPQIAAILLAIIMVGAMWMKITKWHVPFAAMDKTGWEFDLILLAANIVILTSGGGTITFL